MDCNSCKERRQQAEPVSYLAYESMKVTLERTIRRLWILAIVLILLLAVTNAVWIYYESQWEDITITAEQTADNQSNNYAVGGDFYGGEAEGNYQTPNP